jgi:RNA polymerase primary sigma factor
MRQLKITKSITNRENASLEKYLQEIGREELISVEKEIELAKKIRQGDQKALDKMVKANLRFVVSVAKQYQNQGLSLPDLINEGNLGLIRAAKRFDETRGFKFISYAVWWVRQSILQALAEQSRIIKLPLNQLGFINKIKKASLTFEQASEREPTDEEISNLLEVPVDRVTDINLVPPSKHVSLDAQLTEGEHHSLLDVLMSDESPPDQLLMTEGLKTEITKLLDKLTEREADVLRMLYGLKTGQSMTLEEIAAKFDLTRERVRQIKDKALRRAKFFVKKIPNLKGYSN